MLTALKTQVWEANLTLQRTGLAPLTWGNVSGIDRDRGLVVIKPSGVPYEALRPESLVVTDLSGRVIEGTRRPSSDTPTHLVLYRTFEKIGGIAHSHSRHATAFAQAGREIPCLGTTHADHFHGAVPVTRPISRAETEGAYEEGTGRAMVERLAGLDPIEMPAVLVAHHGPFTWGGDAAEAVKNSIALELVAEMAMLTLALHPDATAIPTHLLEKHFLRKHGPDAYYGQASPSVTPGPTAGKD